MKNFEGTPGTVTSLFMRGLQFVFAVATVSYLLTVHFSVSSITYLLPPPLSQLMWSFIMGVLDVVALWKGWTIHSRSSVFASMVVDWMIVFACLGAGSISADLLDLFSDFGLTSNVRRFQIYILLMFMGLISTTILSLIQLWILPETIVSRPVVHPVVALPLPQPVPSMMDFQGTPGTTGGFVLRILQLVVSGSSLVVAVATKDFPFYASSFRYFIVVVAIQLVWSLALVILDLYALSVGPRLVSRAILRFFILGDGVISTLVYSATSGCAGLVFIGSHDYFFCSLKHCRPLVSTIVLASLSWFFSFLSFLCSYWCLASSS